MKLRCIDDQASNLIFGKTYTVIDTKNDCVWLKGVDGGWRRDRFELVTAHPKEAKPA